MSYLLQSKNQEYRNIRIDSFEKINLEFKMHVPYAMYATKYATYLQVP